jgi:hypothetical protein
MNKQEASGSYWNDTGYKALHFLWAFNPNKENEYCVAGLTKPGEVGDFFALVSMKSPNFCQKAKF